jgi:hypothetical protein
VLRLLLPSPVAGVAPLLHGPHPRARAGRPLGPARGRPPDSASTGACAVETWSRVPLRGMHGACGAAVHLAREPPRRVPPSEIGAFIIHSVKKKIVCAVET